MEQYDVSVVPCGTYDDDRVEAALRAALEPIGGLDFVRPGMTVAVKVNLVTAMKPESALWANSRSLRCSSSPRKAGGFAGSRGGRAQRNPWAGQSPSLREAGMRLRIERRGTGAHHHISGGTMKKRYAIFIALCLATALLFGCGRQADAQQETPDESRGQTQNDAPQETPAPKKTGSAGNAGAVSAEDENAGKQTAGETQRQDGERFETVILIEGMEETVKYEHVRSDALGFEMDYDYESLTRSSEPDRERFFSVCDDPKAPENYLEVRYNPADAETVAAAVSAELSGTYKVERGTIVLDGAGSCIRIDAEEVKGGGKMADQLQTVYIIPAADGSCRVATVHCTSESADGFGRRFSYMMNTLTVIPRAAPAPAAEPEQAYYRFNPHLYVSILADDVPQEYWESFYNLCDALRAGESSFACASEEAYRWATDPTVLNALFPAACTKIEGVGSDGSVPFEKGVGRISYRMPADEYVEREAQFEALVEDVLNTWLEPDDDEFEKCLKLYDYMESTYSYNYDFVEVMPDGANYYTIHTGRGQCIDLASVFAFFLLQAGVEALEVGSGYPSLDHAWTYVVIDGKGYHSDPTWSLRSVEDGEDLALYYFLMSGARRAETGCAVDDLTASLLPRYWANFSAVEFVAVDEALCFPSGSFLKSIDEDNKVVRFTCFGEERELRYAQG